jgi:hypothetical protein
MRAKMIKSHVSQLSASVCKKQPVRRAPLLALYHARDYPGMVRSISNDLTLQDLRIRVGVVKSGGLSNAPAWIELPEKMPAYGSPEFKGMRVTVYLRRSFLEDSTFEAVVMAIAHELSHVVLDAIRHGLRTEEPAVDLTAMMLGYSDFYRIGCKYSKVHHSSFWERSYRVETRTLGYLTPQEVEYAAKILATAREPTKPLWLIFYEVFAENAKPVLAVVAFAACLWWLSRY